MEDKGNAKGEDVHGWKFAKNFHLSKRKGFGRLGKSKGENEGVTKGHRKREKKRIKEKGKPKEEKESAACKLPTRNPHGG